MVITVGVYYFPTYPHCDFSLFSWDPNLSGWWDYLVGLRSFFTAYNPPPTARNANPPVIGTCEGLLGKVGAWANTGIAEQNNTIQLKVTPFLMIVSILITSYQSFQGRFLFHLSFTQKQKFSLDNNFIIGDNPRLSNSQHVIFYT